MKKRLQPLRSIFLTAGKSNWSILIVTFICMTISAIGVINALMLRDVINAATSGNAPAFRCSLIIYGSLIVLRLLLRSVGSLLQENTQIDIQNKLTRRLFSTLMHADYGEINRVHSAQWMNTLVSDTEMVAGSYVSMLPGVAGMFVQLIGAVAVIIALEPRFLWLILIGGVLLVAVSALLRRVMKRLHKEVREADGMLRTRLQDYLSSMIMVRTYAVEDEAESAVHQSQSSFKRKQMKQAIFTNICGSGLSGIMSAAYLASAAFCGYGILQGVMSYGTFTAVLQLIGQVQSPMASISGILPRLYTMIASIERLLDPEKHLPEAPLPELTDAQIREFYTRDFRGLTLQKVTFTYPGDETPVLRDVSMDIRKGDIVAFKGLSGSGKSTILRTLMALYTLDEGECRIEGAEPGKSYSRLFAYVPQGNLLMSGTIREIIAFADPEAAHDEDRIAQALRTACADEFVSALEKGVETELGERGAGLSEGQMQRIAIARAVFSGRPVLMLDECTSALDEKKERSVLENIRALQDRTAIIITHRPAALSICSRIIDFDRSE